MYPWGGDDVDPSPFFLPPLAAHSILKYIGAILPEFREFRGTQVMRKSPHIETTLYLGTDWYVVFCLGESKTSPRVTRQNRHKTVYRCFIRQLTVENMPQKANNIRTKKRRYRVLSRYTVFCQASRYNQVKSSEGVDSESFTPAVTELLFLTHD